MKNTRKYRPILQLALILSAPWGVCFAQTSGVSPETQVLLLSEAEGQAQIGVKNTDSKPLLLLVRVYDVDNDKVLTVVPLPPVTRMEPGARQIVRFVLEQPEKPLTVQHYKRVTFEGVPPRAAAAGKSQVQVNLRYDYPVIISPRGLVNEDAPWTLMKWRVEGQQLVGQNTSPYVVRMSREVDLLPAVRRIEAFSRTFVLPGETVMADLPKDIAAESVTGVRLFPATLYGYSAADYDAVVQR